MAYERCPQLEELGWVEHGFFSRSTPVTNDLTGLQYFSGQFTRTFFLPQTHSDVSIAMMENAPAGGADAAYVSHNEKEVALGIKTADCCPILLACTRSKMVAAIHAGWPGALNKIVPKTLHKLRLQGAEPSRMIVAIGPCLHQQSFAVQDDVRDRFLAEQPETGRYFETFEDRWKMDNAGIIHHQLKEQGVFHIWQSGIDTFTHPEYFSYRRRSTDPDSENSRNVSVILKMEKPF